MMHLLLPCVVYFVFNSWQRMYGVSAHAANLQLILTDIQPQPHELAMDWSIPLLLLYKSVLSACQRQTSTVTHRGTGHRLWSAVEIKKPEQITRVFCTATRSMVLLCEGGLFLLGNFLDTQLNTTPGIHIGDFYQHVVTLFQKIRHVLYSLLSNL